MKTNSFFKTLLFSSIILYSSYGNAQNIGGFATDQYNVYYGATRISSYPSSFRVLKDGFAVDQYNAYYGAKKVSSYTTTFKVLGGGFAVDQYK